MGREMDHLRTKMEFYYHYFLAERDEERQLTRAAGMKIDALAHELDKERELSKMQDAQHAQQLKAERLKLDVAEAKLDTECKTREIREEYLLEELGKRNEELAKLRQKLDQSGRYGMDLLTHNRT
jgi:hypothetical protein